MSSAQQAKAQKILKSLLLEAPNKICFTCTQKGPTYVLCPFDVFVCTACSGICRRFNWRVKGVSMSNFSDDEIKALQKGGNGAARELWLARWTPETYALPNPGEEKRIIRFMKLCFEKQAWKKDELPEVVPLEQFLGNSNLPPLHITLANGRPVSEHQKPATAPGRPGHTNGGHAAPAAPKKPAFDDWDDDPFTQQKPAQQQQLQYIPQQPKPAETKPAIAAGSFINLLGDPVPAPSLIPQDPIPVQQQQQRPPAAPPAEQKPLWELFGAGPSTPATIPQQQYPPPAGQNALEQQRLQLQRQQEDLARQQQQFLQQQQQFQQQQQQLQQQQMRLQQQGFPGQAQIGAPLGYAQPVYGVPGQPVYMQQPGYGPVTPAAASKPDPFGNLNWG